MISVDYPKVIKEGVGIPQILNDYAIPAIPWCQKRALELGADSKTTVLCGGSAGALICAEVAYHFMTKGDLNTITGLLQLFSVFFPYDYSSSENAKYKDKYKAWDQYGRGGVPIIHTDLAVLIWCKLFPHLENYMLTQI